jgi:hypothetical protein
VCSVSRALVLAAGENSIPSYGLDSPPKDFLLFAQDFLGPWSSFRELVEHSFHSASSSLRFFILGFAFPTSKNRRPAWFCVRSDLKSSASLQVWNLVLIMRVLWQILPWLLSSSDSILCSRGVFTVVLFFSAPVAKSEFFCTLFLCPSCWVVQDLFISVAFS